MIAAGAAAATVPWWVAPAVIAALIAAVMTGIGIIVNGRRNRLDRQRELFASAFADITEYCEFPYIVRRRRHDEPAEERARISGELSAVQQRLNHNVAILRVEAPRVGRSYADLVATTRGVAGAAIRDGWDQPARTADDQVHVTDVDLSPIKPAEDAYLEAVRDHLALTPAVVRRTARSLRPQLRRWWSAVASPALSPRKMLARSRGTVR